MKWLLIIVTLLIIIAAIALVVIPAPTRAPTVSNSATSTPASLDDLIVVTSPLPEAAVSSTSVTITGEARGNWYFEAVFPIELKDASGAAIAQSQGNAQGDWTSSDYVPFTSTLNFVSQSSGSHGTLILKNDNPSGDPANQKELDIPVTFQ